MMQALKLLQLAKKIQITGEATSNNEEIKPEF